MADLQVSNAVREKLTRLAQSRNISLDELLIQFANDSARTDNTTIIRNHLQNAILEHVHDAIITTDTNFNVVTWNRHAEEMYEVSAGNAIGRSMGDVISHEYEDTDSAEATSILMTTGHWQGTVTQITSESKKLYIMASVSAIKDESGNIRGYVAINRDITAKRQTDQLKTDRDNMQSELEKERQLAELRATVLSTIAHELRTPLSIIMSSADMLDKYDDKLTNDKKHHHLTQITSQVNQLDNMIDELNTMAQAERGYLQATFKQVDIRQFCDELMRDVSGLITSNHHLRLTIAPEIRHITMDAKLMKMAVSNLLSNAIKYSPDGGRIQLKVAFDEDGVAFVVTDEGIGIPDADKATLLRPFQRAENVGDIRGSGLGLSIVHEIVKQHSGTLEFQSKLNQGTIFRMTIPAQRLAQS